MPLTATQETTKMEDFIIVGSATTAMLLSIFLVAYILTLRD
jgi:hypothetical protein